MTFGPSQVLWLQTAGGAPPWTPQCAGASVADIDSKLEKHLTTDDNAAEAIAELKFGGDRVIVENRSGAPLSEADIVSVIPGPTINDTVYENDQYVINETRQDVPVGMIYYVTVE